MLGKPWASERAVWEGDNGDGRDDGMWVSHGTRAVWEEDSGDGKDDGYWVNQGQSEDGVGRRRW